MRRRSSMRRVPAWFGSFAGVLVLVGAISVLPALAQEDLPSGFLDISGTYADQLFDAYCKPIHPPNNTLRLRRVGGIQETDTGVMLSYVGVLEVYTTYWVRNDCPSLDLSQDNCVGLSQDPERHCELAGQSLAVSGTLTYTLDQGGAGRVVSDLADITATSDASLPGPLPEGQDPYLTVNEWDLAMQLGGGRLALGEVTALDGELILGTGDNVVESGPKDRCTCNAHWVEQQVPCCEGKQTFKKLAGIADQLQISGDIEGMLRSTQPTVTDTDNEVQFAELQLLLQEDGYVRGQRDGESDVAYRAYLDSRPLKVTQSLTIKRADDGTYTFGTPGRFVFAGVPVFHAASRGGRDVLEPAEYAVRIVSAHTDEQALDASEQPIPGKTSPVPFVLTTAYNFVPKSEARTIDLDTADVIEAKQSIVDRLRQRCPLNDTAKENEAASYLEQLRLGQVQLTDNVKEGLQRGLWAERALDDGVALSNELLGLSLTGWGTLIADAFEDLTSFESEKLQDARNTTKKFKATPTSEVPAGFNAANLTATQKKAVADARSVIDDSELADVMKKTVKVLKVPVEAALIKSGVARGTADKITSAYTLAIVTFFAGVGNGTVRGGLVPLLKKAIEGLVAAVQPSLLDGVGATAPASFCGLTLDSLTFAVDQMTGWPTADDAAYYADRNDVVDVIGQMNAEATTVTQIAGAAVETAKGLDVTQDAFEVLAASVKWVEALAKASQVAKYGTNAIAGIAPIIEVYGHLPGWVEEASYRSFGMPPPPALVSGRAQGGAASPAYTATLNVAAPPQYAYVAALEAIAQALSADDIGLTASLLTDESPDGYRSVRRAWTSAADALTLAVSGVDPSVVSDQDATMGPEVVASRIDLLELEGEMLGALRELVVDVLTGQYASTTDSLYLARRDRVLALIRAVENKVGNVYNDLDYLAFTFSGVAAEPAVTVETLSVTSDDTGEDFISGAPETFTVQAHVRNLGDQPVSNLGVLLSLPSDSGSMSITSSAEMPAAGGTLAADDGVDGSGADEADVQWTLTYGGDLSSEVIYVDADPVENGEPPSSFVAEGRQRAVVVDPAVSDADLDGLPDDWESDYGLDTSRDDSGEDPDHDRLTNLAELRLGTNPTQADTDADGIDDGDEIGSENGFVTDPLNSDTDDDDVLDGADGDPLNGDSQTAPPPADEPVVSVTPTSVTLRADSPVAILNVDNAGLGTLVWSAESDEPALVSVSPSLPETRSGPSTLYLTVGPGFDFNGSSDFSTTVHVSDVSGATRDTVSIAVHVTTQPGVDLCGHATTQSASSPITATDALYTLRAAVGLNSCDTCLCDANGSGGVTASDALIVLRAAVGLQADLACPLC